MKSKGVNTLSDINKTDKSDSNMENELDLKSMMISCFTYGSINKLSYDYNKYILPYKQMLGENVFNDVYDEQKQFLNTHNVKQDVCIDNDGCVYNDITPSKKINFDIN